MTEDEDRETTRRGSPLLLPVRLLLHWIIKTVVLLFLEIRTVLRPRAVRYGLVALLVVGAIGWKTTGGTIQGMQAPGTQPALGATAVLSEPPTTQLPPSPVVERYLQAQTNFDGKTMWDLISDDMKNSMQATDATLQQLQQQLDAAKQQGRRYTRSIYVGGIPLGNGENVYFYVLQVDGPTGSTQVPYIYVVGTDGKIVSIQ
ncbi:MAG: hypothetical protein M1582_03260 [Actinobacteria bacterium]|nr:hypothetical protein [Actinomycetota bacterium]